MVVDFASLQLRLQLLGLLLSELFVNDGLLIVGGETGCSRGGYRRRHRVSVEVVAGGAVSSLLLLLTHKRVASSEDKRLGGIVNKQIAAHKLQPVGLPLAETRLAKVFYDAFAFDGRLELNDRRLHEKGVDHDIAR